mgnify:CR=1 FL=1
MRKFLIAAATAATALSALPAAAQEIAPFTGARVEALERQVASLEATVEAASAAQATPMEAEVPPAPAEPAEQDKPTPGKPG